MLTFMSLFTCFHAFGVHLFVNYARNQEIGLSEAVSNENIESLSGRRTGTLRSAGAVSLNTAHSSPFMSLLLALSIGGKIGKKQVDHSVQPVEKASSLSKDYGMFRTRCYRRKENGGFGRWGELCQVRKLNGPRQGCGGGKMEKSLARAARIFPPPAHSSGKKKKKNVGRKEPS